MEELTNRLQRIKMLLISALLTVAGTGLIILDDQFDTTSWWGLIPFAELGGIIIGVALLSIWIDAFLRREQQASDELRTRRLLTEHAPAMRDAVLDAFAANQADLARVATPDTLDRIITNSLGLRLADPDFAAELYADLENQVINSSERWRDASVAINLTAIPATKTHPAAFDVTVRWEYTTIPKHHERRFICTSDRQEYAELSGANTNTSPWYFKPDQGHDAGDRAAFELLQFSVDGHERPIRRSARKHAQTYTVAVGSDVIGEAQPVSVAYTYRTITPQNGHLLIFDIEQPTRDLHLSFDYTRCGIDTISAIDLIPATRPTRIEHSPPETEPRLLRVEIDGWTFPRAGIAIVWTLDSETGHGKPKQKAKVGKRHGD